MPSEVVVGHPSSLPVDDVDWRMREALQWSDANHLDGGFPTFEEVRGGPYGEVLRGTVGFRQAAGAERCNIPKRELRDTALSDIPAIFRAIHAYAFSKGRIGGLPTFYADGEGDSRTYNAVLWRGGKAHDVPVAELGNVALNDVPGMFRAANRWAIENERAAGVPTFNEADYGGGVVYGIITFSEAEVSWRDVSADVLALSRRFTFEPAISEVDRLTLLRNHGRAYHSIRECSRLNPIQKSRLILAYRRAIRHGVEHESTAFASAKVNGNYINVNFGTLLPRGDPEVARTLIHEMMHVAGYDHPDRRDGIDEPGDGGPYYGTAPLQAEVCIDGTQTLLSSLQADSCSISGFLGSRTATIR